MLNVLLAADEPNGVHLPADIQEVYWGSLAFFVVLFLLIRFAGPIAVRGFRRRTERIERELAEAADAREQAQARIEEVSKYPLLYEPELA